MPDELPDDATHEQITAYVDAVVKEAEVVIDEKAKSQNETLLGKGDSQRIAEGYDETPIAEVKTGEEDTAQEGEDTGAESQDWLDDDLKAEVAAYGIGDDELADFTSREELERALRFFDRSAMEAGRKAMSQEDGTARDEKGRFTKQEPKEQEVPKEGRYEIGLDKDLFDDELVGELTRMRDHYESRLEAVEARFAEIEARAEEQQFDNLVDSLGHADLFGTTGKETPKQLERRQDLHVAAKAQVIGLQTLGRDVDLDKSLLGRVARMVFADELGKKDLKARTRKVLKQSNGRMGGGATRATDPPESLEEEMNRLYKEMEMSSRG